MQGRSPILAYSMWVSSWCFNVLLLAVACGFTTWWVYDEPLTRLQSSRQRICYVVFSGDVSSFAGVCVALDFSYPRSNERLEVLCPFPYPWEGNTILGIRYRSSSCWPHDSRGVEWSSLSSLIAGTWVSLGACLGRIPTATFHAQFEGNIPCWTSGGRNNLGPPPPPPPR